ncbi:uncharacterized protein LOC135834327 [Planococcus citri]|uniref:uncharacterized protein LOC135834327 n=1 Tax=Planococcus citri TaxID=170843 RepID=UPI0031FA135E
MANVLANIYDLVFPSPPALRDIASIAVAAKLFRKAINENVSSDDDVSEAISVRGELPYLPSTLLPIVERYFDNIEYSWDYRPVDGTEDVDFDAVICDFNGNINYDRVAKQAMFCEETSDVQKFEIACRYCLEDHIIQIWPSVSEHFDLNDIVFRDDPLLYYWICRLRNQLHKVPLDYGYVAIDGNELECLNFYNWTPVEYFWNRLKVGNRIPSAAYLLRCNGHVFCRHILATLSEEELKTLMTLTTESGDSFMCTLLNTSFHPHYSCPNMRGLCILAAWEYVKHKVSHTDFICAVREIIKKQTEGSGSIWTDQNFSYDFWNTSADHLKQIAIQDVLLDQSLFIISNVEYRSIGRDNWLIWCVLKDAPLEARSTFWYKNWRIILPGTRTEDLQRFITLCCQNETEMLLFRKNNLSKYENISQVCLQYLKMYEFEKLNEYWNFCYFEIEKQIVFASQLKLLTDYVNFLHSTDGVDYGRTMYLIKNINSLSTFIENTCNDVDLAADLKNQILLAPRTIVILARCVALSHIKEAMQFVDLFAKSEQATINFKLHIMPSLVNVLSTGKDLHFTFDTDSFASFVRWCLVSDDKISEFKRTVTIDEIVRNITQYEEQRFFVLGDGSFGRETLIRLYSDLAKFLEWLFSSPEKIAEVKKKFDGFEQYTSK